MCIRDRREAKAKGSHTLAICNVVGSMITREAAGTIYTHAGPEIGVASTKAFTCQLTALYLFALYLAQVRGAMTPEQTRTAAQELTLIPVKLETIFTHDEKCEELAKRFQRAHDFLFLSLIHISPEALRQEASCAVCPKSALAAGSARTAS